MKTYKCSICQQDWPENYCPDCHRTIGQEIALDDFFVDGDVIRGSWSTCAAKIRLNPVRYLWFKGETRFLLHIWLAMVAVATIALTMKWWIIGGILGLVILPLSGLLWWVCRQVAMIYQNAALTAGMVVSQKPLEFISLADMDSGVGVSAYAVKRVAIHRLPCHQEVVGSQFPCVSGFRDGATPTRWGDFDPQPLSFGTGDSELIAARRKKMGEDAFTQLRSAFEAEKFPQKAGELIWLDEMNDPMTPPPIPKA